MKSGRSTSATASCTRCIGPAQRDRRSRGLPLEDGQVITPTGFKDAWKKLYEAGLEDRSRVETEHGGAGRAAHAADRRRGVALRLEHGVQHVPGAHVRRGRGDRRVRHARAEGALPARSMFDGTWGGTMCLTEPQAGTDVGSATHARRRKQRRRQLRHQRHEDLHLRRRSRPRREHRPPRARARRRRARRAPRACRCSSCRKRAAPTARASNDVTRRRPSSTRWASTASATCVLELRRERRAASASSSARAEQQGHVADVPPDERRAHRRRPPGRSRSRRSAYLNALEYAKERKQGSSIKHWKDADRAARADHRARRRAPHAARHEVARRRHPRARREAHDAPRSRRRVAGKDDDDGARTTRARSICSCRSSRRTAPIRRSASARRRSRSYGGAGYTQGLAGRAVLPRLEDLLDLRGHEPHPGDGPRRPQAGAARRRERAGVPRRRRRRSSPRTRSTRRSARA